jgi:protease-4
MMPRSYSMNEPVADQTPGGDVVAAQMVAENPRRAPAQTRGCLGFLLALLGLAGLAVVLIVSFSYSSLSLGSDDGLEEKYHSLARRGSDKVAIITIEGTILDGEGYVKKQIDRVRKDDDVKAVVVRVDSPGGTVTGSDYILHHLNKLRNERSLPMIVSMGGMAASGGYYVSMCVGDAPDSIFAEPTTWTGSIGVIIPHYNVSGLMDRLDIEADSIASHRLKGMGSLTKKMTEEERAIFQQLVDDAFTRFKDIIKSGRPQYREKPEELDKIATGQVFTTNQALANGLVDKEGFIEAAIERAIELASLDKDDTKAIKYKEPLSFSDLFVSAQSRQEQIDLARLLDFASPRAWYLYSSLPRLTSTE